MRWNRRWMTGSTAMIISPFCSGYFSFDRINFTAQIHNPVARDLVQVLAIPEPATRGMMIAGFGMVGLAIRRQRRTPAAA